MTINPCCIPLKTGVRMVTHLSMALALAVGWTALKLISISSDVSSSVETTTSTGVIKTSDPRDGGGGVRSNDNIFIEQQPPPQSFYNAHIFESHQVPPQYRIPYEYILYHKWHQQQMQMQQQHAKQNAGVADGYRHNFDSQPPPRSYYDDIFWYLQHQQQQQRQRQQPLYPSQFDREDGNLNEEGFESFSPTIPIPPPSSQQQQYPSPLQETNVDGSGDDDDEHSKIFRSVLHHRKNFKGGTEHDSSSSSSSSSSLPPGDSTSKLVRRRNSTRSGETTTVQRGDDKARVAGGGATATMPQLQVPSSSRKLVPNEGEEPKRERGHVSKDRSSSSQLSPLQDEKESRNSSSGTFQVAVAAAPPSSSHSQPQLSSSAAGTRRQRRQQQRHQPFAVQHQADSQDDEEEEETAQEMNRPRTMMLMMSQLARENSQRNGGVGYYGGISGKTGSSPSQKLFPDFEEQYAKTLLICGLLALCTVVFQFLTSFLLFCFIDKGSNAAAQIWTAVHCSVIFCLATCLVLFLCEGLSMPKYVFDETLYLSLVTIDSLLAIYFLWVVMAFI